MASLDKTLIAVAVCGSVVAAGVGAIAGTQLRIPPAWEPFETPTFHSLSADLHFASAPAYPSWAPPPLYPQAERDPFAEFQAAWDAAFDDMDAQPRNAAYAPPPDLPPSYVVRVESRAGDEAYQRSDPYEVRREERERRYASRDAVRDAYRDAAPPPREAGWRRPPPPREYRMEPRDAGWRRPEPPREYRMAPPPAPYPPRAPGPGRDPRQVREDIARAESGYPVRGAVY